MSGISSKADQHGIGDQRSSLDRIFNRIVEVQFRNQKQRRRPDRSQGRGRVAAEPRCRSDIMRIVGRALIDPVDRIGPGVLRRSDRIGDKRGHAACWHRSKCKGRSIGDDKARKTQVGTRPAVAGRRCHSVADGIGADDEVMVRIKRPAGPDQEVQPMMDRTDRRQDKDRIVARGRAGTVRHIADLEIRNDFAAFEREITKVDFPMRTVDPARL
jgi:hypothetical protein